MRRAPRALATLLVVGAPPLHCQAPDSAVRSSVLAFYRDDRAHRWPDVLNHFTVGKVAARWPAPTGASTWVHAAPAPEAEPCRSTWLDAPHRMAVARVDRWARVFITWCDAAVTDEVWLVQIGAAWKIARLERNVRGSFAVR